MDESPKTQGSYVGLGGNYVQLINIVLCTILYILCTGVTISKCTYINGLAMYIYYTDFMGRTAYGKRRRINVLTSI